MLRKIKESKLVRPIYGLLLTSMVLSFPIGIWGLSTPTSTAKDRPTISKVLPKPSTNNIKDQALALNQANTGKNEQTITDHNNWAQPNQNEDQVAKVAQSNIEKTNPATAWKPTNNINSVNYVNNIKTTPAKPPQPRSNSYVDIYLLARVIHAESRGEPFEGQVAVGAVLINRLKDSRFPDSLNQIIFKRGEFCTVRDGQIWKDPSQEAIKAARLAAAGWDPTGGALYFYNPAKTTSRWIWSRPVVNQIGNHIFAA